jgi:hypothetical protein
VHILGQKNPPWKLHHVQPFLRPEEIHKATRYKTPATFEHSPGSSPRRLFCVDGEADADPERSSALQAHSTWTIDLL